MDRSPELEKQLYDEIKQNEVCYYQSNAIYRSYNRHKGFMYSVNNLHLFEMFSEALDYIDMSEHEASHPQEKG